MKNVNYVPGKTDAENYEKTVCIETHENVTIEYEIAGVGSRSIAAFVDKAIRITVYVVSAIIAAILIFNNYSLAEIIERLAGSFMDYLYGFIAIYLGIILLSVIYHMVAELVSGGSSPGKKLVGIKVVQVTGEAATPVQIIIRNLLRMIDQVPGGPLIDGLIALYGKQGRRVGDLAAGTMVIKYRKGLDLDRIIAEAEAQEKAEAEEESEAILTTAEQDETRESGNEEGAGPAFFSAEETEMLRKYLENRKKYVNMQMYDQRFATLVAQRRGYEKTTGFKTVEARNILDAAYAYMSRIRFEPKTPEGKASDEIYVPQMPIENANAEQSGEGND